MKIHRFAQDLCLSLDLTDWVRGNDKSIRAESGQLQVLDGWHQAGFVSSFPSLLLSLPLISRRTTCRRDRLGH
jgi:hypothetical protein